MAKILWISWKDIKNPDAGGAERVTHEIRKRLILNGHQVTHLTGSFKNASNEESINGVKTIRVGKSKLFLFLAIIQKYKREFKDTHDIIIEEVNTSPFFINYFKGAEKLFLFFHQLAEEVWNYETSFPLNLLGQYILEPFALFLEAIKNPEVLAMSKSTKDGLIRKGFNPDKITILPEATDSPIALSPITEKEENFTVLYHGNLRKMKRPEEVLKAFAWAYRKNSKLRLWVSGHGTEERKQYLKQLSLDLSIDKVTKWYFSPIDDIRNQLMSNAHIFAHTSVKEGWGTVVTEAGKLGTPAIVYDVEGLRDAVDFGKAGILIKNGDYQAFGDAITELSENPDKYKTLQSESFAFNRVLTFDNTYDAFKKATGIS